MLKINKGISPSELIKYKKDPNSTYEDISGEDKEIIKKALLSEQGYICAYCMQRIETETSTIEHYKPRNPSDEEANRLDDLNYNNMLAVCDGNQGAPYKQQTCDSHKGNKAIVVNPLNSATIDKIKYKSNGEIYSEDEQINKDLIDTLNLNCEAVSLPQNRKAALNALYAKIKNGESRDKVCRKIIEKMQVLKRICLIGGL